MVVGRETRRWNVVTVSLFSEALVAIVGSKFKAVTRWVSYAIS